MQARAVIGASFGDEGKGLLTDWLCFRGDAGMVVRFNGGSQAGHTVVTPQGERHVFHHMGSGSFLGVPTYLSQFFVCNPIAFFSELAELEKLKLVPEVYAHPDCLITTFADILINRRIEDARGPGRHGSCGIGFGETINRSDMPQLRITCGDLWNGSPARLESKLVEICDKYARFRTGKAIDDANKYIQAFLAGCRAFAETVAPLGIQQCKDPVFESAQGLALSIKHYDKNKNPHTTRSYTGMENVRILMSQAGIDSCETWYVSRTYLTRHGAGSLPGENPKLSYEDSTNLPNTYQGTMRFAPLAYDAMRARCTADYGSLDYKLALTHCDQFMNKDWVANVYFNGPTRNDAQEIDR